MSREYLSDFRIANYEGTSLCGLTDTDREWHTAVGLRLGSSPEQLPKLYPKVEFSVGEGNGILFNTEGPRPLIG